MARDLLAQIPFREVFVILALFLPQLTFVDEAATKKELWSSPTVRKFGLLWMSLQQLLGYKACMNIV